MKKDALIQIVIIVILAIILGVLVKFTIEAINENNMFQMGNPEMAMQDRNMPGQMNNTASAITYSGAEEITEDTTIGSGEYTSETSDENAILVSGNINVTLSDITVNKTGDSDGGDNTSFYGINSGIIARSGANLTLKNIIVTTNATGANGIKGHANFIQVDQANNAIANTVSTSLGITSMIVGQYYMNQINGELAKINDEISKISSFQNNEYKSKILALIIQVKRISTFQTEIIENKQLRDLDIYKLNTLEQSCIELLGQANLTIKDLIKEEHLDYKKYTKELTEIHDWHIYQKTLLEILYKITDLKNILYLGTISKEQLNIVLDTYTKQVVDIHEMLISWHEKISQELGIDTEASRRKRTGFDGVIHWIPGLFKDDFNFSTISENTKIMIEEQSSGYNLSSKYENDDLFNKDVKIIAKDGKIYYLP